MSILDFDKARQVSAIKRTERDTVYEWLTADYEEELERQAQAAVQQEREAIYAQWASAVTNFNAPNICDFHNWLSRRLRESL